MAADLKALFEEYFAWRLRDSPEFATLCGSHVHDDLLDDDSLASFASRALYPLPSFTFSRIYIYIFAHTHIHLV